MKRFLSFFLCFLVVFAVCGCKNDGLLEGEEVVYDITTESSQSEEGSSENAGEASDEGSGQSGSGLGIKLKGDGTNTVPDLDSFYPEAAAIYRDLINYTFSYDADLGDYEFTVNGSTANYYRVNDERFGSKAELKAYLNGFFTEKCQKTFYQPDRFLDRDGKLYAIVGAVAEDPTYAGYSFKLTKQTNKRIFLEGTGYYHKSYDSIDRTKPIFTTAPADASVYNTVKVEFVLLLSDDGSTWLFDQFGFIG